MSKYYIQKDSNLYVLGYYNVSSIINPTYGDIRVDLSNSRYTISK